MKKLGSKNLSAVGEETMDEAWDNFAGSKTSDTAARPAKDLRRLRKINPIGMRVVVRIRPESNQTDTGLYLPEGAKENMNESLLGEVIEVASAIDDETTEAANISGIPLGSLVLLPKKAGVKVPWDEELRIVDTKEILAMVHEINVS